MTLAADRPAAAETFDSLDPATGQRRRPPTRCTARREVEAAVARAREAALWWQSQGWQGRRAPPAGVEGRAGPAASTSSPSWSTGRTASPGADAILEITLAVDHLDWAAKHAPKVLGPRRVPSGLMAANQAAYARVPAARRRRRDRAVELPGLHADGVDRLRPGGRQRRRVQAERVHARASGAWLDAGVAAGGARAARRPPGGDRARRHRRRAVPGRRRQDRLHRLGGHRPQGHGRLRRGPGPGAHGVRRQGRDDRRRRRRRGRRRRRRAVGRA